MGYPKTIRNKLLAPHVKTQGLKGRNLSRIQTTTSIKFPWKHIKNIYTHRSACPTREIWTNSMGWIWAKRRWPALSEAMLADVHNGAGLFAIIEHQSMGQILNLLRATVCFAWFWARASVMKMLPLQTTGCRVHETRPPVYNFLQILWIYNYFKNKNTTL